MKFDGLANVEASPKPRRIHVADLRTSKRLQKVFRFLHERGERGATGGAIIWKTRIVGLSDAIWELRSPLNGAFKIACEYQRTNRNGSRINRFTLDMRFTREQRARLGWMAK